MGNLAFVLVISAKTRCQILKKGNILLLNETFAPKLSIFVLPVNPTAKLQTNFHILDNINYIFENPNIKCKEQQLISSVSQTKH